MNEIISWCRSRPKAAMQQKPSATLSSQLAKPLEELNETVRDAIIRHFEESDRPKIIRLHFVREEVIAVSGCWPDLSGAELAKGRAPQLPVSIIEWDVLFIRVKPATHAAH